MSNITFRRQKHEMIVEMGAEAQKLKIERFQAEEIILNSYIHTDNDTAKDLLHRYEKLILLCRINYNAYKKHRRSAHLELVKYIEENNYRRQWVELCHVINNNIKRDSLIDILVSEMMETWMSFTWDRDTFIVGLTKDNTEWIERPQYYGDYDNEFYQTTIDFNNGKIKAEKYVERTRELYLNNWDTQRNEQSYTVTLIHMIALLNQRTMNIYPKEWVGHFTNTPEKLRLYKDTSVYKDLLATERKYIIDRKGVTVRLKNAGKYREVLFMEDLTYDGRLVMLYKMTDLYGDSTMGYFFPNTGEFFCGYKYAGADFLAEDHAHNIFENFILELYCDLTCDLPKDRKRIYAIKEVEDLYDPALNDTNIYVQYEVYSPSRESEGKSRKGGKQRSHQRIYTTRKLPEGRKASEDAIERAKEYGIDLQDGETFVRPYWVGINQVRKEI
ncbi:hypothetical protein ABGV42_01045 [Paenibacillus pabuli]|uniref:hypothetical protein n=1 Tax=Paenibacillus pabuli TaxID=1472 RepID=UPI003241BEB0